MRCFELFYHLWVGLGGVKKSENSGGGGGVVKILGEHYHFLII